MLHPPQNDNPTPLSIHQPNDVLLQQASSDSQLLELWLHGRPASTQKAYRGDLERMLAFVEKPLHTITLGDLQAFADDLEDEGLAPASRHRIFAAVKSLFAFGCKLGYFPFDTARPLHLPPIRNTLPERILDETEVKQIIALEPDQRNRVLLLVLYIAGIRVSEACALRWCDCQSRSSGGQINVHGKGGKTRVILIPRQIWEQLIALRNNSPDDVPVFKSRKGGHLHRSQMLRIVRKAAKRAGINKPVSPHWMRHAHASHSLDHGAPIHVLQACLAHSSVATTGRYLHARPTESSSQFLEL